MDHSVWWHWMGIAIPHVIEQPEYAIVASMGGPSNNNKEELVHNILSKLCLSVCLSVCLSLSLSVSLFLSLCLSLSLSVSLCLSLSLSVYLCVCANLRR